MRWSLQTRKLLPCALGCLLGAGAFANPTGMQVVAGQVSAVTNGNQLLITNSPGAILNWQSFSIMPGELTRFIQQGASSSVLNRITGQDPSQILGALQSNGKVYLINPNGIIFGSGARVDVAGLVAASLGIGNADFQSGKLTFTAAGNPGAISNYGQITTPAGGQVYLIAPDVTNSGLITSPTGDVMLAAGRRVTLADSNNPDMRVIVSAPADEALNIGKVVAESGRIGLYGALVDQHGLLSANSAVVGESGKIILKSSDTTWLDSGSVTSVTGAGVGGEVEVLGSRVGLASGSSIVASGRDGGGSVLIGGDTHGQDPSVLNADFTYLGNGAQIQADALESGSGGKVVVWSNQQTQMYGDISARGGLQGGNGGFVETSSANRLDFQGSVDLRAPSGTVGTLLLDPSDILISSGPTSSDVTLPPYPPFTITGSNPSSVLSATDLQNELILGNVTVSTSSAAVAPLSGTITVTAPVTWANSNSLTLAANESINISAPITAATGTLVLNAAHGNIVQALNLPAPAAISVASLSASAPNGSVSLTEPTNNISGPVAGVSSQGFSLVNSGTIDVGTVGTVNGLSAGSGTAALVAGGDITATAPITASELSVSANGNIELSGVANSVGTLAGSAGGSAGLSFENTGGLSVGSVSAAGVPTMTGLAVQAQGSFISLQTISAGDITLNAPVMAPRGSAVVINSAGGIVQGTGGQIDGGALTVTASGAGGVGSSGVPLLTNVATLTNASSSGGPVYITNGGALLIDYVSTGGSGPIGITAAGSITTASAQTCDCTPSVNGSSVRLASLGDMNIGPGFTIDAAQQVSLYAGYDASSGLYQVSNNTLTVAGTVSAGAVTLSAGGAISTPGTVTGSLTETPNQTLAQCIANPALPGCTTVLPTLAQCAADPVLAGCSAVLPPPAQIVGSPSVSSVSRTVIAEVDAAVAPVTSMHAFTPGIQQPAAPDSGAQQPVAPDSGGNNDSKKPPEFCQ